MNYYLDISAIGNEYQVYSDTPTTWGIPQDGNGKAGPGNTAAVAVAVIDCTSAVGDGAQTLSILGVTVSNASAGSGATLAASLVASINATTTATISTYCQALLPLNKLIFARQNPGAMAQVQIMMRIAGADWNTMAPTHAGFTTGPTITAFTGGVDGPFAYFINGTTVFGKTLGTYGLLVEKTSSPTEPAVLDVIHSRTRRSAINLTCTLNGDIPSIRTPLSSTRNFLFDNGSIWSGDNGVFLLSLTKTSSNLYFGAGQSATLTIEARSQYGFYCVSNTESGAVSVISTGSAIATMILTGCKFESGTSNIATTGWVIGNGPGGQERISFLRSYILLRRNAAILSPLNASLQSIKFINTIIEWIGIGADVGPLVPFNYPNNAVISFEGCDFIVDSGTRAVATLVGNSGNLSYTPDVRISIVDCRGIRNPSAGFAASPAVSNPGPIFVWSDPATYSFRIERTNITIEYVAPSISGVTLATLGTTTPTGDLIAYRFTWEASRIDIKSTVEAGRFSLFYKDIAAAKTCDVELLVPTVEIPTKAQLYLTLSYTDSGGTLRNETSAEPISMYLAGIATALPAGIGIGGAGQWVLNSVANVSSVRLRITTAYAVKQNSEIVARILIAAPPTGTRMIYASPEIRVS